MNGASRLALSFALAVAAGCAPPEDDPGIGAGRPAPELLHPQEVHLADLRQLTFGGENAEAYFAWNGTKLIYQSDPGGRSCDQIFVMDLVTGRSRMVSTGQGRTTCGYFFPDGRILYASTHLASPECPPPPDYSRGYVWKLYPEYEIFAAHADGSGLVRLTDNPGYDAEATVSTDGSRIVFTSMRDGDLDLYTMRPDGSDLRRLTHELGYDGGAFFSPDGTRIVWRASRPRSPEEEASYRALLAEHAIRPMNLEIFVANSDGTEPRQVTDNGQANFAPCFFPDGQRIIFASNMADPGGRNFDLWMVRDDGTELEQVTFDPSFDGFPVFSPDGRYLVFSSNRGARRPGETNLFLARWVDRPRGGPDFARAVAVAGRTP